MIAAWFGKGPLGRIVAMTRDRWRRFLLASLLGAVTVMSAVGLLTTSGYLISRAAEEVAILSLTIAIVGVRFFGTIRALFRYSERLVSHDLAFRSLAELRVRFFERLIPLVPGGLAQPDQGDLLSRFVGDVDRLQDLYLRGLTPPVVAIISGVACVVIAFLILPGAALVLASMLLLGGTLAPWLTRLTARTAGRRQRPARARLSTDLLEIAAGSAEIAVAGREADWLSQTEADDLVVVRLQRRDAISGGLAVGTVTFLSIAAAVAVAAVSIPSVTDGTLAGVMLAAVVLLALASFEGIMPLGQAATGLDACAESASRIEAVTDRPDPTPDPPDPAEPREPERIAFDRVSFAYGSSLPSILDEASFAVRKGEAVALVGPSGTGKSTVAELMVRFRDPDAGRVELGGIDLTEIEGDFVREQIRLSPQDSYLFTGSLRENVALARPEADDEVLETALREVGLGEWLDGLADGLDTEVGEGGSKVSGGQRQRIAAARGLLSDAPFLIFDEPTAHLDPEGAAELEAVISGRRDSGNGVLVITHSIADPASYDRVLEMTPDGTVVEARAI